MSGSTIAYDLPVADYIARLDATGHVTHQSFTKKSVTLHHNGGVNFSHDTILNIWVTRPASAHFDVDSAGSVAQYVRVNEYAWAVGDTTGNEETISIEMADATGDPTWHVSDATWKAAARLAAWLFANVVHARPDAGNYFVHHHWSQTGCAGPYIDSIWSQVLAETQRQYDALTTTTQPAKDWFTMATVDDLKAALSSVLSTANIVTVGTSQWSVTHVLDWLRRGVGGNSADIAGLKAAVQALGDKAGVDVQAVYAAASKGAQDGVQAEIAGASASVQVNLSAVPAAPAAPSVQ